MFPQEKEEANRRKSQKLNKTTRVTSTNYAAILKGVELAISIQWTILRSHSASRNHKGLMKRSLRLRGWESIFFK